MISPILKDKILYINLHAEQCYYGTFQADALEVNKNLITGIFEEELNKTVFENVFEYIKRHNDGVKHVVIDFSCLKTAQKNLDAIFISIKNVSSSVILTNIHTNVIDKLSLESYCTHNAASSLWYEVFYIKEEDKSVIIEKVWDVYYSEFEKHLTEITRDSNKLHHSSSVYLSKFIDIKMLMVKNNFFFIYTIYWLALKMAKRGWKLERKNKITLFCQNLNSSYIASLLSSFLLLDVITFDHIGPINKVYNEIDKKIQQGEDYIVIADVVCIGTEVRLAKNIIEFSGGKYIGNASIVRIMTMNENERFIDIENVYEITKENNKIDFKINTALNM